MKNGRRLWAYSLGQKEGRDNREADKIALTRTLIMVQILITNFFIIAGNIRHWNDHDPYNTSYTSTLSTQNFS